MFERSPLFQRAAKEIQQATRDAFSRSGVGQVVQTARRAIDEAGRSGERLPYRLERAMERYQADGWRAALRTMRGTRLGALAGEIERYAKGGPLRGLLNRFLGELGPAGVMLKALMGLGKPDVRSELETAAAFIRAHGGAAFLPDDPMLEVLQTAGMEPVPEKPGHEPSKRVPVQRPRQERPTTETPVPMAGGGSRNFPPDHPIVTGDMLPAPGSSNVHSFGYDAQSAYLYVRFLGYTTKRTADGRRARGGPGSLYRYANVTPEEFLTLMAAASKGDWVWDHLRIRGTWSGHQKDYELVGVEGGYVPRKATVRLNQQTGQLEEWLIKRRVRTDQGDWLVSAMREEQAGPMPWGVPDRGTPDRGEPDRGRP